MVLQRPPNTAMKFRTLQYAMLCKKRGLGGFPLGLYSFHYRPSFETHNVHRVFVG